MNVLLLRLLLLLLLKLWLLLVMDNLHFGLFHLGRAQRTGIGPILFLLRFLRFSLHCALVLRDDTCVDKMT